MPTADAEPMTAETELLPLPEWASCDEIVRDMSTSEFREAMNDYARANMEPLHAENERLAEALRPFAALDLKPGFLDTMPDDQPIFARNNSIITVRDVRRARAALQEKE